MPVVCFHPSCSTSQLWAGPHASPCPALVGSRGSSHRLGACSGGFGRADTAAGSIWHPAPAEWICTLSQTERPPRPERPAEGPHARGGRSGCGQLSRAEALRGPSWGGTGSRSEARPPGELGVARPAPALPRKQPVPRDGPSHVQPRPISRARRASGGRRRGGSAPWRREAARPPARSRRAERFSPSLLQKRLALLKGCGKVFSRPKDPDPPSLPPQERLF